MTSLSSNLDTGAGPTLIRNEKGCVRYPWQNCIKTVRDLGLSAATKQTVEVEGCILLPIKVGDLCVPAWFRVVPSLAAPLLLGTSFYRRARQGYISEGREVRPQTLQKSHYPFYVCCYAREDYAQRTGHNPERNQGSSAESPISRPSHKFLTAVHTYNKNVC